MYKTNSKGSNNNLCEKCGQKPTDAVCFTCKLLFCFQCCIQHSQSNTNHVLQDLQQSIQSIMQRSKNLIVDLEHKQREEKQKHSQVEDNTAQLRPENFQRYIDQIDFIKKQVLKFVDRFFGQLNLEFINMWEAYLMKFTTGAVVIERIEQLINWIKPYTILNSTKPSTLTIAKTFINENFDDKVAEIMGKSVQQDLEIVPECPRVVINQRILAEIQETLCKSIHTMNYRFNRNKQHKSSSDNLRISRPDTLDSNRKVVPIFPMRSKFCYLFNIQTNDYEIQEFDKVNIIPAYPKTILLPNGDIHLIGGLDDSNNMLQHHTVYRHYKGELAKMAQLPQPKNPTNGLVYHNNGYIYAIGGLKGKGGWDNECCKYDIKKNEWKMIPSMNSVKPHQTVVVFQNSIIAFGLSFSDITLNIERLDIDQMKWTHVSVTNPLSNPFNFTAGLSAIQINEDDILMFGGKNYEDSLKSNKRTTDKSLCQKMFLFSPQTSSFTQLDRMIPGIGIQSGEINPLIISNSIMTFEFLISKVNPIGRWDNNMLAMRIFNDRETECLTVLQES